MLHIVRIICELLLILIQIVYHTYRL